MPLLRPYQHDALTAVYQSWDHGIRRPLISLPTGCGKTVVFAQLIAEMPGRALVLVHRDELLRQATEKLVTVALGRPVGPVAGPIDDWTAPIVVASVQSLHAQRLRRWPPGHFNLIVVDEAHHAASPSYRAVLDYLAPPHLLGVTATPYRADRQSLAAVFDTVAYHLSIPDAIREGWICDIETYRLTTSTNLDPVPSRGGDFVASALEAVVDTPERNQRVLDGYVRYVPGERAIVFAAGVQHATHLLGVFTAAGIPAAVITGAMDSDLRRQSLAAFHTGALWVLINVSVLVEGFDEPDVRAVILARPTKSLPFFVQAVGRGTRLAPGKSAMILLDLADVTTRHRLISIRHLLGIPTDPPDGTRASTAQRLAAKAVPAVQGFFTALMAQWQWEAVPDLLEEWIDCSPLPGCDWRDLVDELEALRAHPEVGAEGRTDDRPLSDAQRMVLLGYGWPEGHLPTTRREGSWVIERHLAAYASWAAVRARAWARLLHTDAGQVERVMFRKPWDFTLADARQLRRLQRYQLPIPPVPLYQGEVSWMLQYVAHQRTTVSPDAALS